jgi:hypothetical protein
MPRPLEETDDPAFTCCVLRPRPYTRNRNMHRKISIHTVKALSGSIRSVLIVLCIVIAGCGPSVEREAPPSESKGDQVVTLSIDLQDGFADDTVVLRVNGDQVFRKEHVTTKGPLGYAESFAVNVSEGALTLEVDIEAKAAEIIPLEVHRDTFIGISIFGGVVDYLVSDEPFRYQ